MSFTQMASYRKMLVKDVEITAFVEDILAGCMAINAQWF